MAHLIDLINGKHSFSRMSGTTPAWHGLGQVLTPNMTIEEMQALSCMDFEVIKVPNHHFCPDTNELVKADDFGLIRRELSGTATQFTGKKYANVSEQYKPVQPHTIVKFFHDLAKKYDMQIDTIGAIDGGRKVWAMAKLGKDFTLAGGDTVEGYALICTSYDATMATRVFFTFVRVVCNNTLQMAMQGSKKNFISVSHSTNFDAEKVVIDMGIVAQSFTSFQEVAQELSQVKVSDKQAARWLIDIFEEKGADPEKLSTRKSNIIRGIYNKFQGSGIGSNLASAEGTAWGLLNSITEYYDHDYGRNPENRFNASQMGVGATAKTQALEYLTETLELSR